MKKKKGKKVVAVILIGCFLSTYLSSKSLALEESDTVLLREGKSLDVVKVLEQLEHIVASLNRVEIITRDDIESMLMELNSLAEELHTFLFTPDGELMIESDDECTFILVVSALWIQRCISSVVSLLRYLLKVSQYPPETPIEEIRITIRIIRKFIETVVIAPIAGVNGILSYIQFLHCRRTS